MAPFRIADCLWMEGDRAKAAASYARLAKTASARTGDAALARFRVAEAGRRPRPRGGAQAVPGHRARLPGAPAGRRGAAPPRRRHARDADDDAAAAADAADAPPTTPPPPDLAPGRPAAPRRVAVQGPPLGRGARRAGEAARDAAARSGRRARLPDRDDEVPHAARLPDGRRAAAGRRRPACRGDKAASAQFHGARALSRVDRDDEAIAGYRKVDRAVSALALGGRGAVPVRVARVQPRALPREHPGVPGDAGQVRQQRVRRRRRLEPGVRALPARQRRRGGRRLRALRPPARDRHRLRRDRRARDYWRARLDGEGRARRTRPRPATASSRSARRSRSTACWRARA